MPRVRDLILVLSAVGDPESGVRTVAAAVAGGGRGILDLGTGNATACHALSQAVSWSVEPIGVRVPAGCGAVPDDVDQAGRGRVDLVVLPVDSPWRVAEVSSRYRTFVEVCNRAEALAAAAAGAHGLIARGREAGGEDGELSTFVLLQLLLGDDDLQLPVWAAGGIGPYTARACVLGGAAGVVLDRQLALMPESDLPADTLAAIRRCDGSDGSDGFLALTFAQRWPATAAAVRGIRATILDEVARDPAELPLAFETPLARALGVPLPVAQGPMTRVSDEPAFAAAVAEAGGLPFVALAVNDAQRCRTILAETATAALDRPWGVGLLGFAPEQLRADQLAVVKEVRPSCAIIAGGRPSQAKELEAHGITTFLHVPSPDLLRQFLDAGVRRFVFEGSECGGHIGPRASFPLWEAQLAVLDDYLDRRPDTDEAPVDVLFAGGIHDARSAAMAATAAATVARRGARIGVLMGTAYLFTREAVDCQAIQPLFQRQALAAEHTVLLRTAPGHATRCLPSPFADEFDCQRAELESSGASAQQVWSRLEELNVGRLRIASKGIERTGDELVAVGENAQLADGLFMAGQVATLRNAPTTIAALHTEVTGTACKFHTDRIQELREEFAPAEETADEKPDPLDVAVVGLACVFPQSADLAGFWQTVVSGRDAVTEVPPQRWDVDTYYSPAVGTTDLGRRSAAKWGGFIDPVPFDALGYGIPPAALGHIDPTQLIALEVAARALKDAGYAYDTDEVDHSRTGVVFGAEAGADLAQAQTVRTMLPGYLGGLPAELDEQLPTITEDSFPGILANVVAGRIANRLDLGGVNFTVDAACASSLAALDVACRELVSGNAEMMLCGGADLHNGINDYLMFTSAQALSPTGRCRSFDAAGDGTVLGEGVACVVLKRLGDAQRDGDRIYAVIKGIGAGSDGRGLGLTAPRPEGQRRALERAYRRSGVSPTQVGLVEAHGTGTVAGDRVELDTLTAVYTEAGAAPGDCALGSVKSQIGHTRCAAGMAGLIKAVLAVHSGTIPPTGNLREPNAAWDLETSPFAFHTRARPWAAEERYAAVSAFGFGGTNYHVVLASHAATPQPRHSRQEWPAELFYFRGATRAAGHEALRKLAVTARNGSWRLRDLAGAVSRESDGQLTPVQVALVARDLTELTTLIDRALEGVHDPAHGLFQPPEPVGQGGKVALLFPGQGSQRPDSLADLFTSFPELHRYLRLDPDSAGALFPPTAFDERERHTQELWIRQTDVAQPVLGIGALAVGHLLGRLGIRADMAAGHSYGELAALHAAGAFDERSLLELSHARAAALLAALGGADEGAMAAVTATADQVRVVLTDSRLDDQVVLANYNAPTQVVISGPARAVEAAAEALAAAGLTVRTLPVACAFHSPQVAGAVARFADSLAMQPILPPVIPVWCHGTALPYPPDPAEVRRIVAEQLAAPVRFAEQIEAMYAAGARTFVEVGPGQVLSGLVRLVLGDRPHVMVACDRGSDGLVGFLSTIAELACAGVPLRAGWLFHGRDVVFPAAGDPDHPMWTVDGQLVRDEDGNCVPGGLKPARKIKELALTGTPDRARTEEDVLCDLMRTSREIVASHRDAVLSYFAAKAGRAGHPAELTATGLTFELPALPPLAFLEQEPQPPAEPDPQPAPVAHELQDVDVRAMVLDVLSERTGYPVDFIDLDLDLEADLSIDSIKRTEVAGEIAQRLGLAAGDDARSDELVQARTVGAILSKLKASGQLELPPAPELPAAEPECPPGVAPTRLLTSSASLSDPVPAQPTTLAGSTFLITGDTPVAKHLAELLGRHGANVRLGAIGLSEADGFGEVDGLILLDGLAAGEEPLLPESFPFLKDVLSGQPRWLLAAVGAGDARTDGVRGLFRAIDREYPRLTVRVVVDEGAIAPELLAGQLVEELLIPGTDPVVLRRDGTRYAPELVPAPLPMTVADTPEPAEAGLHRGSVIVLFGGARGITTRFGHAAASADCTLELVGRTPLPEQPEDEALASARDSRELRARLVEIGGRSAAEIDRAVREIQAHREVLATVEELRSFGGEVRYHAVDVRDADAVHGLLEEIHDRHGRIDGVVHAAGVIEDKLLADKDIDSFARVFETKVQGARAILGALDELACSPRFVVFYGSISACYGNRGQSDYAAANDALEAIGQRWAVASGNRCLTVHWGPWQPVGSHGGMVSGELARDYAHRGIGLIDPQAGADALLAELAWGDPSLTSVVYTASEW